MYGLKRFDPFFGAAITADADLQQSMERILRKDRCLQTVADFVLADVDCRLPERRGPLKMSRRPNLFGSSLIESRGVLWKIAIIELVGSMANKKMMGLAKVHFRKIKRNDGAEFQFL